jgi:uncharacterized protein (TIGR02300 family)
VPEGLGHKHVCSQCQTKFYDLNKPDPACPRCGATEFEEAGRFVGRRASEGSRAKRAAKRGASKKPPPEEKTELVEEEEAEEDDEESDELDLVPVSDEELDVGDLDDDEGHSLVDVDDEDSDDEDARDAED